MNVDLGLAIRVRRLARENIRVTSIAARLNVPEETVVDALSALGLPLPGESVEPGSHPPDEARAAMRDRMPKRNQDRLTRIDKGRT